ncbi:MAG: AAA family ATPase, partial [Eubacteriales bacterium]
MKEYKPLPIGIDNFEEIILQGCYYVDKTLLIKTLLDATSKVTLFTRPRRFGKSLNLSMLQYFFENRDPSCVEKLHSDRSKLF